MQKKWNIHQITDSEVVSSLQNELAVDATIAKLLSLRGITSFDEAKSFFLLSLDMLHDPFLMIGMGVAVDRLV